MRNSFKFILFMLVVSIILLWSVYVAAKQKSKGQKDWVTNETSATRIEYVTNIKSENELMSDFQYLTLTMSELRENAEEEAEKKKAEENAETSKVAINEMVEETEEIDENFEVVSEDIEIVTEENEIAQEEVEEAIEELDKAGLVSLGEFCLTAYCACTQCCGAYATGTTASGTTATANRTIAVDTSVIPFGTEVVINGNTYIAEDTGGAIDGNRIDVFFDSHQDALNFGVQYTEVFIRN